MARIFVSYRRTDWKSGAELIAHRLRRTFGPSRIFLASDDIGAGDDFDRRLQAEIRAAKLVVVIVGPDWLRTLRERAGRADTQLDWVVREIELALLHGRRILPVHVDVQRDDIPSTADLPESIRGFATLDAFDFSSGRTERDSIALLQLIRRTLGWWGVFWRYRYAAAAVVALTLAGVAFLVIRGMIEKRSPVATIVIDKPTKDAIIPSREILIEGTIGARSELPDDTVVLVNDRPATVHEGVFSTTMTVERDGSHTIVAAISSDALVANRVSMPVEVDATPPALEVSTPTATFTDTTDELVSISGRVLDEHPERLWATADDEGLPVHFGQDGIFEIPIRLAELERVEIVLWAEDAAGHRSERTQLSLFRRASAVISITEPEAGAMAPSSTILVRGTIGSDVEAPTSATILVNGTRADVHNGAFSATVVVSGNGRHSIEALLDSDRFAAQPASVVVEVDESTPSIALISSEQTASNTLDERTVIRGRVVDEHPHVLWTTVNGEDSRVQLDQEGTFEVPVQLARGETAEIALVAEDRAGHRSTRVQRSISRVWLWSSDLAAAEQAAASPRPDWRTASLRLRAAEEKGLPRSEVPTALLEGVEHWEAPPSLNVEAPVSRDVGPLITFSGSLNSARDTDQLLLTSLYGQEQVGEPHRIQVSNGRFELHTVGSTLGPIGIRLEVVDGVDGELRLPPVEIGLVRHFPCDALEQILDRVVDNFTRLGRPGPETDEFGNRTWNASIELLPAPAGECTVVERGDKLEYRAVIEIKRPSDLQFYRQQAARYITSLNECLRGQMDGYRNRSLMSVDKQLEEFRKSHFVAMHVNQQRGPLGVVKSSPIIFFRAIPPNRFRITIRP